MERNFEFVSKAQLEQAKSRDMKGVRVNGETYPTFNGCEHYVVDMSDLRETSDGEWMQTISIKLPNDKYVTVCVMQPSKDQSCLDIQYHGDDIESTRAIGFKDGRVQSFENSNLYTIVMDS